MRRKEEEEEGEGTRVWGFGGREGREGKGREGNRESEESVCINAKEREFGSKRRDFVAETEGGRESLEDCTSTMRRKNLWTSCQGIEGFGFCVCDFVVDGKWDDYWVCWWEIQRLINWLFNWWCRLYRSIIKDNNLKFMMSKWINDISVFFFKGYFLKCVLFKNILN